MSNRKILLINGHPRKDSYCNAIVSEYEKSAVQSGHSLQVLNLSELNFDLNLRSGYSRLDFESLEPDIQLSQKLIQEADHLVFVFPSWWASMPALLKGWIDRVFLPGFAFKYRKNSPLPEKLLLGKSASIFITMDAPSWYYWLWNGEPGVRILKRGTLEFCGVRPVKVKIFGPIRGSSESKRKQWLDVVSRLAAKGF